MISLPFIRGKCVKNVSFIKIKSFDVSMAIILLFKWFLVSFEDVASRSHAVKFTASISQLCKMLIGSFPKYFVFCFLLCCLELRVIEFSGRMALMLTIVKSGYVCVCLQCRFQLDTTAIASGETPRNTQPFLIDNRFGAVG